jgi:hypothetical protein
MRNSCGVFLLSIVVLFFCVDLGRACPTGDPPIPVIQQGPSDWYPLAALWNGYPTFLYSSSYDPECGYPFSYDQGINDWQWSWSGLAATAFLGSPTEGPCAQPEWPGTLRVDYAWSTGVYPIELWVHSDDGGWSTAPWETDLYIFQMSLDATSTVLGVGETATMNLGFAPDELNGSMELYGGSAVSVWDGENEVIGNGLTHKLWVLHGRGTPSSVTVRGETPGTGRLRLAYCPSEEGGWGPGGDDNWAYLDFTVVGLNMLEIWANGNWHYLTPNSTITLLKGTQYTFRVSPLPTNAPWPIDDPVWSYDGSAVGSAGDSSVDIPFGAEGTRDLVVACGTDQIRVTINVIKPVLNTVTYGPSGQKYPLMYGYNRSVPVPEYQIWPPLVLNGPACWTKGTQAQADVTFCHNTNLTFPVYDVVVRADTSGDVTDIGNWCDSPATTFGPGWPSAATTCIAGSTIRNFVHSQTYSAQWKYKVPSGMNQWIDTTSQSGCKLYAVLDMPQAPQAQPWTPVLDMACAWAWSDTSASSAAADVVYQVYYCGDTYSGYAQYYDGGTFRLTACLSEWGSTTVNCWDCANMVCIFSNALGCPTYRYYMDKQGGSFYLNYIAPIGGSWTNDPFPPLPRSPFALHWTAAMDGGIFDACLQVDGDSNPTTTPCVGEQPIDMTFDMGTPNIPFDDYRGRLVDPQDASGVTRRAWDPSDVK